MPSKRNRSSNASKKRFAPISARRFFVAGAFKRGDTVAFDGSDAHKIAGVLRLNDGDALTVFDSTGTSFAATLEIHGRRVAAVLGEATAPPENERRLEIAVAQGIPKGQKMDFVVEKLTELGVARIFPLKAERSIGAAGAAKIERWRRLAKSAAQQCGSARVPVVEDETGWARLLDIVPQFDRVLVPWEVAEARPLRDVLPSLLETARRVLIVIGPEGGFSHAEIDRAQSAGAVTISMGRRIFRTETAALVLAGTIAYLSSDL